MAEYKTIGSRKIIDLTDQIIDEDKDLICQMIGQSSSASIIVNFNIDNGMIQYQTEVIS